MTTTVYVPADQIEPFEADCTTQGMGFAYQGESVFTLKDKSMRIYHIWHNKGDADIG